jgi:hypothetical protein
MPKQQYKRNREKVQKITLQLRKECYITGQTHDLHKHHVFGGNGRRNISEKYGLYVWLRADWHNMSNYGVHFNHELDMRLKQMAQIKFEEVYSRKEFIQLFGKNYL